MIRFWFCLSVAALVCVLGLTVAAVAQDFKAEEGFTLLFNGKDLTGWKYPGIKGTPVGSNPETSDKRVEVKDGAIVMNAKDSAGKGGIKDLYTVEEFDKDFVLKLEFRAGEKADSGVHIRGNQLQIRDFIRRNEQKHLTKFKNDDWNELVITVTGTEATFTVNGEQLKPEKMKVPTKGAIGLQAETGKFEFRRIRIKTS
jgi:hypothetical protein